MKMVLKQFVFLSLLFLPYILVGQSGNKVGGISFRIDDDQPISNWLAYAKIFDKYGYHFDFSLNLGIVDQVDDYYLMIRNLQASGHELCDHTPNHTMLYFTVTDTSRFSGLAGVDHIHSNIIFLKYNPSIDTSLYNGQSAPGGCIIDIIGGKAYSRSDGAFRDFIKLNGSLWGIYIPGTNQLYSIGSLSNVLATNSNDIDTLTLLSYWGENISIKDTLGVWCHFVGPYNVHIDDDALKLLAQRTLQLCNEHSIDLPITWVQCGGLWPYANSMQVQRTLSSVGYSAAASDPYTSHRCYNEYDPEHDHRFGIEWGDFYEDTMDLQTVKAEIANFVALHYFEVGHSHFRELLGGWDGYQRRMDSLLAWCKANSAHIQVKTYSEMAHILYDVIPNPYVNIIPPLNVDLDNNGSPDGYFITAPASYDTTDGVINDGHCSIKTNSYGNLCYIQNLAGLEKGENDFSIWTKGTTGDKIAVAFIFNGYPIQTYEFPASTTDWAQYTVQQSINGNVALLNVPIDQDHVKIIVSCSEYKGGTVKISGMSLRKKLPVPLKIISAPDTMAIEGNQYLSKLETASTFPGDTIFYRLVVAPYWLKIDESGNLSGVAPRMTGVLPITVVASDQHSNSDSLSFNLYVVKTRRGNIQITSLPDTVVSPNATYYYSVYATSAYLSDTLQYFKLDGPQWLTMSSDGILSGTAPFSDSAGRVISILVQDQHANVDTQTFSLTIHPLVVDSLNYYDSPLNHGWFANLGNGEVSIGYDSALQVRTLKLTTPIGLEYGVDKYGRWLANTITALVRPNSDFMVGVSAVDSKSVSLSINYYSGKGQPSLGPNNTISFYLGNFPYSGNWQTLSRDLNADLSSIKWGATVRRIRGISLRGSVEVADLALGNYVGQVLNVDGLSSGVINSFKLEQNYPNPFNPTTTICYDIQQPSWVTMIIFNALGQRVKTLFKNSEAGTGRYSITWHGENDYGKAVSSGIYFCRFEAVPKDGARQYSAVKKMLLLR